MKINQIERSIITNSFFSRMVQMRRYFLTTCTKPLHEEKNIKQMCYYGQEKGRSMVEMLGVLGIIGVLSVGAIAGYSKAMFKQKMNKTMDILSHALTRIAELDTMNMGGSIYGASDMIKYGIMPDCDVKYANKDGYQGVSCPLPLGEFSTTLNYTDTIYGALVIDFIQEPFNSCIAFFNSGIYKNVPEEWWYPLRNYTGGYISVYGSNVYGKAEYALSSGAKSELSAQDILDACKQCKNNKCSIQWWIRH